MADKQPIYVSVPIPADRIGDFDKICNRRDRSRAKMAWMMIESQIKEIKKKAKGT